MRSGKAHSTSELSKGTKPDASHRRCSSDSCRTWNVDEDMPAIVIEVNTAVWLVVNDVMMSL